jgi:predicted nicotinamide N-methyase
MGLKRRQSVSAFGIRALLSNHRDIRRLKRSASPHLHGNQIWSSSWLLIDYLDQNRLQPKLNILEIGCGWGLTGIYCAKAFQARVTGVDIDPEVFPYLDLHTKINKVKVNKHLSGLNGLSIKDLKPYDVIVGSDICYWETMVLPLKLFINRALRAGAGLILLADPGREPFNSLCDQFIHRGNASEIDWTAARPRNTSGKLLKIRANPRK